MLASLDNEVHFKKVFTDVEVFTAFVKDVLNIDIQIDKVETEKVLPNIIGAIRFKMDLFAEDKASRTVVEIQKVDYDYTYNDFSHYFFANLLDAQRSTKTYSYEKDVYIIVIVTAAHQISSKTGETTQNEVLLTDLNPADLNGQIIKLVNRKMVILNHINIQPDTPESIVDWLMLIRESIKNPEHPNINTSKPAIAKAAMLAEKDALTPEQLAESKIQYMRRKTIALLQEEKDAAKVAEATAKAEAEQAKAAEAAANAAKAAAEQAEAAAKAEAEAAKTAMEKAQKEGISKAIKRGKLSLQEIAEDFEVPLSFVEALATEMNNKH